MGYCFEALLARRSTLLRTLPISLSERHELVAMGYGGSRDYLPLHSYVTLRLATVYSPLPMLRAGRRNVSPRGNS